MTDTDPANLGDQCLDSESLCNMGRKLMNVGTVRMAATINGYCPFVGIKEQVFHYVLDANTLDALPLNIRAQMKSPGYETNGVFLAPNDSYLSNLLFVNDQVVGANFNEVRQIYDGKQFLGPGDNGGVTAPNGGYTPSQAAMIAADKAIYLHYSWNHTGSAFSTNVDDLASYNAYIQSSGSSNAGSGGGSVASSGALGSSSNSQHLARWTYKVWNVPPTTQKLRDNTIRKDSQNTKFDYTSPTNCLMPEQAVVGDNSTTGVHWKVEKRLPVFQGADFFVVREQMASASTNADSNDKLLPTLDFLDVNLENIQDTNKVIINGAVVSVDEFSATIPVSKVSYDLNNQVYFIIEIGCHDPNNHYFILITERGNPLFVHVTNKVAALVQGSNHLPRVMAMPVGGAGSHLVSRILSRCDTISGRELLNQERLTIAVQNYMGRMLVWFSDKPDPWVIERTDPTAPPPVTPAGAATNKLDPTQYTYDLYPMVVPADTIALYGGNQKVAFLWGYRQYIPEATVILDQPAQIVGTSYHPPTHDDIALLLGYSSQQSPIKGSLVGYGRYEDMVDLLNTNNSSVFSQDAQSYVEYNAFDKGSGNNPNAHLYPKDKVTFAWEAPLGSQAGFKLFGKGYVGEEQTTATALTELSTIQTGIYNENTTCPVVNGENRAIYFWTELVIQAGTFTFPADSESQTKSKAPVKIINAITPIATGFTCYVPAQDQAWYFDDSYLNNVDVSHHIMHFTDSWATQDYAKIDHTGTIKLLCNRGMTNVVHNPDMGGGSVGSNCVDAVFTPTGLPSGLGVDVNVPVGPEIDYSDYICGLVNRNFYIQLQAWYQNSQLFANPDGCSEDGNNGGQNQMGSNDLQSTIFTGFCEGGKVTYTTNSRIFEAQVVDLAYALQQQNFLNSPFFDSVRDVVAVYEILVMAGFRGVDSSPPPSKALPADVYPAQFVAAAVVKSRNAEGGVYKVMYYDGCYSPIIYLQSYALPGAYALLQQPKFKFSDGEKYWDALVKMATAAGKVVYFDRFGICHYEDRADQALFHNCANVSETSLNDLIKETFYASPVTPHATTHGAMDAGKLAYNSYTWQRHVGDVRNQIQVVTVSPNGGPIFVGDVNLNSIDTPNSEGFVGFTKLLLDMNGMYGSLDAAKANVDRLTAFYTPTLSVSFETFGRSYLKALDIISFTGIDPLNNNGLPQPLRIISINSEIDPVKNVWWSKIETEWIYCGAGVTWRTTI